MADDKGTGGGGGGWEAFEIVIVILLVVGLLNHLTGKDPVVQVAQPIKSEVVAKDDSTESTCGLNILRPHPSEKIVSFVTLTGNTAGCNWTSTESVALYAQVVDAYGVPVSDYTTVAPSAFDQNGGTTFSTSINLTATPTPGTGYLILIPTKANPDHTITSRIPIKF